MLVILGGLVSHLHILMRPLAAKLSSTTGFLLPSQCLWGTILVTLYSMLWDWQVLRTGLMFFYWPKLLDPFLSCTVFPFSAFFPLVGTLEQMSSH